ncbi:YeaH/YhbH family protein [Klebsiella variicola subsp. variicola]|nr:YeaH/YhbH family protein [Klebsiella variicola subsp. variicola]
MRRYKAQIKQSISEAINKRSVTDIESGESVSIPTDDINEPMFHQGAAACATASTRATIILCKTTGLSDRREVAAAVAAVRGKPAPTAKEDEFVFQISKDEYLDLLFEDLALPNLKKNQHRQLNEFKPIARALPRMGCQPTSAWCVRCRTRWPGVRR